jgi:hypothetical protein
MKMLHSLVLIIMTVMGSVQSFTQEPELKNLLKQPYQLNPKYKLGDKDYYHMQTVYLNMNDSGRVAQTQILDGYFVRECMSVENGKHRRLGAESFSCGSLVHTQNYGGLELCG